MTNNLNQFFSQDGEGQRFNSPISIDQLCREGRTNLLEILGRIATVFPDEEMNELGYGSKSKGSFQRCQLQSTLALTDKLSSLHQCSSRLALPFQVATYLAKLSQLWWLRPRSPMECQEQVQEYEKSICEHLMALNSDGHFQENNLQTGKVETLWTLALRLGILVHSYWESPHFSHNYSEEKSIHCISLHYSNIIRSVRQKLENRYIMQSSKSPSHPPLYAGYSISL
jgi:hypothetical protein